MSEANQNWLEDAAHGDYKVPYFLTIRFFLDILNVINYYFNMF